MTYRPFDQERHLGPPPWSDSEALRGWEAAHNHDVRTKCHPEFGCMAIDYEREAMEHVIEIVREDHHRCFESDCAVCAALARLDGHNGQR